MHQATSVHSAVEILIVFINQIESQILHMVQCKW